MAPGAAVAGPLLTMLKLEFTSVNPHAHAANGRRDVMQMSPVTKDRRSNGDRKDFMERRRKIYKTVSINGIRMWRYSSF